MLDRLGPGWRRLTASAEWRFLGALRRASPRLAAAWWAMVVLRGALPAALAVAMGALVGAVQAHGPLAAPLAAAGLAFVAVNALGPLHEALGANLGARGAEGLHQ